MAFDERLAARIRSQLGRKKGLTEKKLFGGIGFLINGNLACAVSKKEMLVRVEPEATETILEKKHTRVFGTRPMKGWILVAPEGLKTAKAWRHGLTSESTTLDRSHRSKWRRGIPGQRLLAVESPGVTLAP